MPHATSQFYLTAPGPRQSLNPDLVTFEWVRGGRGFGFTRRRSPRAPSSDKSPSCGECLRVRGGHGSAPHPDPSFYLWPSSLPLFHPSRSLFNRKEDPRGTMAFFTPTIIPTVGMHTEQGPRQTKGFLMPLSLLSPPLHLPLACPPPPPIAPASHISHSASACYSLMALPATASLPTPQTCNPSSTPTFHSFSRPPIERASRASLQLALQADLCHNKATRMLPDSAYTHTLEQIHKDPQT